MTRTNAGIFASLLLVAACTTVPAGYVGVKVNNYGSNRGVSGIPIVTGRVFYNPWTEDIYKFPTFFQNEVWTSSKHEGRHGDVDESITFNSIEGTPVNVDIGMSVAFDPNKVPEIFLKFRKDPEEIIDIFVRNAVRDAFSRHASTMRLTDIMGTGRQQLLTAVFDDLKTSHEPQGFLFQAPAIIGDLRLDPNIKQSISAVLQAGNKAVEAERLAAATVAKARGDSASVVIAAEGQAHANELLNRSVTPTLIQYQAVQSWNGVLPSVTGNGAVPFINLK